MYARMGEGCEWRSSDPRSALKAQLSAIEKSVWIWALFWPGEGRADRRTGWGWDGWDAKGLPACLPAGAALAGSGPTRTTITVVRTTLCAVRSLFFPSCLPCPSTC